MKMYKKSELSYENGYIVKKGKVVCISNGIVGMFNKVEEDYQRAVWNREHRPIAIVPPQEEFEFESEHLEVPKVEASTPHLDEAVETATLMMDELDAVATANEANSYIESIKPLFEFVSNDKIISPNTPGIMGEQRRFNLKHLGNPLELTEDGLLAIVKTIVE